MKTLLWISLIFSVPTMADEITIQAVVGDQTSSFEVKPEKNDYQLTVRVNLMKRGQTLIGKKNYLYVVQQVQQALALKQENVSCQSRDHSTIEYKNDAGKASQADFCYLDQSKQSKIIRSLVDVMSTAL